MAVTVDWGTGTGATRTQGIYGIYNKFVGHISQTTIAKIPKGAFRIRVTALNDTSKTYIKDVDGVSISGALVANVNAVQAMQVLFFDSEYTGVTENTSSAAYSGIQIEIGLVSAASETTPPTFGGYDTDDTFYFYNGYEVGVETINCYREPKWYDTTPILLPKVKKTIYTQAGNIELLSIPSYLNIYPVVSGGTNLKNLVTEFYNSSGSLLSTATVDLRSLPAFSGVGYWNININPDFTFIAGSVSALVYAQWIIDGEEELINSDAIVILQQECNPKNDLYRLRWVNRYGGEEYQNFTLKHDKKIVVKRGKKIQSSGVDFQAADFDSITNINNPNLREYGNSYYTELTIRTDFITQEEIDSLAEAFRNNSLLLTFNGLTVPVMALNGSYDVLDVKQKLQKVEMSVRYSNFEPNQI